MKTISDEALLAPFESARSAPRRSRERDTTEALAGELLWNRAMIATLDLLCRYAVEHGLTLHCDFAMRDTLPPVPVWTVRIDRDAPRSNVAHRSGPVLANVVHELAVSLSLLPRTNQKTGAMLC